MNLEKIEKELKFGTTNNIFSFGRDRDIIVIELHNKGFLTKEEESFFYSILNINIFYEHRTYFENINDIFRFIDDQIRTGK